MNLIYSSSEPKFKSYQLNNFRDIPQVRKLSEEQKFEIEVVGHVLPFKANNYVVDRLIDWDKVPDDPMYALTFPQKGMLLPEHFDEIAALLKSGADKVVIKEVANRIRIRRWEIPVKWVQDNGYDMPVGQDVTAFNSTNYEILVYAKSALFFDSLYQEMGRDKYLEVLRTFIDRYRFKTPTPDDFLSIVKEVGGIDPTPLYEKWILGTEPISGD